MASMTGVLTPAPSTDISAQKADSRLNSFDAGFILPPAALGASQPRSSSASTSASNSKGSDSSYRPVSPLSPAAVHKFVSNSTASSAPLSPSQSRKRSFTQRNNGQADEYALPPPPTRTRKIIQMKPKGQQAQDGDKAGRTSGSKPSPTGKSAAATADGAASTSGGKRKAANSTTAASRKVARKTAHSLIERRRRSKMNEEFGVLKDMIPACSGQEMHKLAILQASIEYMRYLEKCVSDLKAANQSRGSSVSKSPYTLQPHQQAFQVLKARSAAPYADDEEDSDGEMSEASPSASEAVPSNPPSTFSVISPQLIGSAKTSPNLAAGSQQFYFRQPLTLPSPAFLPQQSPQQTRRGSTVQSPTTALPSPALLPQADHEATAALMMLGTDRRSWDGKVSEKKNTSGLRGMSVRDLLSSS